MKRKKNLRYKTFWDYFRELRAWLKKQLKFSKFVVLFVIYLNIEFTKEIFKLIRETGIEPSALIAAWFAFTTVEVWSLSNITKAKVEQEEKTKREIGECVNTIDETDFDNYKGDFQ